MVKMKIPSTADVAEKWVTVTPARATYYEKETPAAADYWFDRTTKAGPTYKSAVTAPDIADRFTGGVKRVGAEKFIRKVKAVGVARYGPGITAAKEDYSKGIDPYLAELGVIDIPERKPRGDPGNLERVRKIMTALHKKRLAILAAGT